MSEELLPKLKKNLGLHLIITNEVNQTPWGQITFNVQIIDGVAQIETLNIVKNRRRKYHAGRVV